jgi:hypothetical protein
VETPYFVPPLRTRVAGRLVGHLARMQCLIQFIAPNFRAAGLLLGTTTCSRSAPRTDALYILFVEPPFSVYAVRRGLECICIALVTEGCMLGTQKINRRESYDLGRHGMKKCQEEYI